MSTIFENRRQAEEHFDTLTYSYGLKVGILYYGRNCDRHNTNVKTLSSKGCVECNSETKARKRDRQMERYKRENQKSPLPKPKLYWPVPSLSMGGGRP